MTNPLREALADLATEVPAHVVPDGLAQTAWRSGRRRRLRRLIGTALLLVVAAAVAVSMPLLLLLGDLESLMPANRSDDTGVRGYPQRVGHEWFVRDLPDRPGPMAGLMSRSIEHETWDQDDGWYVLSETGHRWRLHIGGRGDDAFPTISPDGRRLGYLVDDLGPYVIRDLVTGQRVEFPEVASGRTDATTPFYVQGQSPSFWSADGSKLLLWGGRRNSTADYAGAVVLGIDGTLQEVDPVAGVPAGFGQAGSLVWVSLPDGGGSGSVTRRAAVVTAADGTVLRRVPLHPSTPWQGELAGQWTAVTSPDGRELLVVDELPPSAATVHRFSLADGSALAEPVTVSDFYLPCGMGWAGSTPTVPVLDGVTSTGSTALLDGGPITPIVAVEPGEGTRCFIWASEALTGRAHGGLFGLATGWWTWWWRELLTALLATGAGWALLRWRRRQVRPARQ